MNFDFSLRISLILGGLFTLQTSLFAESIQSLDKRIQNIEEQLKKLPLREPGESGGSIGILVSRTKNAPLPSEVVTLDLETSYPIDHIVLVPTRLQSITRQMEAVGFPLRFDLVGSEKADFSNPIYFYTGANKDYPDPKGYPVIFDGNKQKVRYLRMMVYSMPSMRERHAFSLAELFVFSDQRNVALKKTVKTDTDITWGNLFSDAFLVDGQTSLGQPIIQTPHPPSVRGWHAKVLDHAICNETIQLQFDAPHEIEEIRLYPVQHSIWPKNTDYGFPIHFQLQIKEHGTDWITIEDWSETPFPRPGNSPVSIPLKRRTAEAIRLKALSLPQSIPTGYIFALAEMEVYEAGSNVAPQGRVSSSSLHQGFPHEWNEQALTDGLATQGRIIPLQAWLEGLAQRGKLETEMQELTELRIFQQTKMARILRITVSILSASLLLSGALMVFNRKKRQKQLKHLQNRIASDLHDEIGSNLASITILAAGAQEQCDPKSLLAQSLRRTVSIAKETSSSMHDIVWMLHPDRKNNMSLTAKLQDIAGSLLADINFSFGKSEDLSADRLSMDTLHHFILFYKEVLHNLAKHSNANQVDIALQSQGKTMRLVIIDNGTPPASGSLPDGLKLRAEKMKASLTYQTQKMRNQLSLEIL